VNYPRWKKPEYSEREDRYIRRRMQSADPIDSRAKIRQKRDITRIVDHFAEGLGSFGEEASKVNWLPIILLVIVSFFVFKS
jgi:hypothetical protein